MPPRPRKDEADAGPLSMASLNQALDVRFDSLTRTVQAELKGTADAILAKWEQKMATTLAKLRKDILVEVENMLTEACTTFEERLGSFDKRAEEVTNYSAAVKASGAVAEAAQAQVTALKKRLETMEERQSASRMRDIRLIFTQAAGGQTQEEARAFARRILLDKGGYGGSPAEQMGISSLYTFPIKTNGTGYMGKMELPDKAPCWALVGHLDAAGTVSRLLRLDDIKGRDIFVQVTRDLTPTERNHRKIILASPAYVRAKDAFMRAKPDRFPRWVLDRVELDRGDWWDVSRAQAGQGIS